MHDADVDLADLVQEALDRGLFARASDLCDIGLNRAPSDERARALRRLRSEARALSFPPTPRMQPPEPVEYATGISAFHDSDFKRAAHWLRQAAAIAPESGDAHAHLGMSLIAVGELPEGWREYEWRERLAWASPRKMLAPRWKGEAIPGGTLLVWDEQGSGDAIQFVRFAIPAAAASGARVIFHGHPRLVRLVRSCPGIAEAIPRDQAFPTPGAHASLMSLPAILGADTGSVGAMGPYLFAEPALGKLWSQRLATQRRPRIGLVWQGNPAFGFDHRRSLPLSNYLPLIHAFGARASFVSLQKGAGEEQLAACPSTLTVPNLGALLDNGADGFVETAAVMANLDLVISSDTAAAHLAGALGVPVWIALGASADWRWGQSPTSTPFYASAQLFRCGARGWPDAIDAIGEALDNLLTSRSEDA